MLIIKFLFFFLSNLDVGPDFLPNHLLGDDAVAQVLLEVFKGNALHLRCLFQIFHGLQVHLLANLVQPLNKVGIRRDSQVLAFVQQQILVNQPAQHVLFPLGIGLVGVAWLLLLHLLLELFFFAEILGAGNDLGVDPGNDLLHHHRIRAQDGGHGREAGN